MFWICSSHALNFVTYPPHLIVVKTASQECEVICSKTHRHMTKLLVKKKYIEICELGEMTTIEYMRDRTTILPIG